MHRNAHVFASGLLAVWLVLPFFPLAVWSFARSWYFPAVLPTEWSLLAWAHVFAPSSGALSAFATSFLIAAAAALLGTLIGVPAGRALGLGSFRGKAIVELFLLAPMILPGIATVLGLHAVFIRLGLTGTMPGVILAHLVPALPYMIFVMSGLFASYDIRAEQQARTLGATPLQAFWHVTLPAIWPGVAAGALFAFLVSWSQYLLTLVIGSGRVTTMPMLLFNFATSGRNDFAAALAMLYIIPGVLILLYTSRKVVGDNAMLRGYAP